MSLLYPPDEPLFSEFQNANKSDWLNQVSLDLTSKDFDKLLLGKLVEGLKVYLFYAKDDLEQNFINYHSLSNKAYTHKNWGFQEHIPLSDKISETIANSLALKALEQGTEALCFDCSALAQWPDIHLLTQGIIPEGVTISWKIPQHFSNQWKSFDNVCGVIHINPLEEYLTQATDYHQGMDMLSALLKQKYPGLNKFAVNGSLFVNSGATVIQEIGLTCSLLVTYLDILTDRGHNAKDLFKNLEISLATRSAYFVDIAKYRAMQLLLHQLAAAYEVDMNSQFPIRAVSSTYNKSAYDLHTNMLRNTSEAMAAVIGGCKTIAIKPHTGQHGPDQSFARRMARNISHILRQEAHMGLVQDTAAGSYAIEALTSQITAQAWAYFLDIENEGGLLEAFRHGKIQQDIGQSASDMMAEASTMKKIFVGSNRYVDQSLKPPERKPFSSPVDDGRQNLQSTNALAVIESIRYSVDNIVSRGLKRPCVGLISINDKVKSSILNIRFSFVQDVFASIGVSTSILTYSFLSIDHPAKDLKEYDALVLVSDDEYYATLQPERLSKHINKYACPFLLAGNPTHMIERLHEYSLSACIYKGMYIHGFADKFFDDIKFRANEA